MCGIPRCRWCSVFVLFFFILSTQSSHAESVRLYRDTYGVPHVFAESLAGAYYGAGYAVAEDMGWATSQLALKAEGRQAEFFEVTRKEVDEDIFARHFHFYRDAQEKFAQLSDEARTAFRAYTAGIAARYRELPAPRPEWAIEVTAEHLVASFLSANFYQSAFEATPHELKAIGDRLPYPYMGSNAFVIGPGKTADNSTMHFAGPQTPFGDNQAEIHLEWPGGRVAGYGYGLFMDPGLGLHHAWGATANWPDTSDIWKVRLDPDPDRQGWYWDPFAEEGKGGWAEMTPVSFTLKIRGDRPRKYTRWESRLGPVLQIVDNECAYVWRPSGLGRIEYVDAMLRKQWAPSLREALSAADPPEVASGNWVLADQNGDIAFLYNGRIPGRENNGASHGLLSGDNKATEWLGWFWGLGGTHPLPSALNPACRYLVSSNEAPWLVAPSGEIKGREAWPQYVVPSEGWGSAATVRGERLRELLGDANKRITMDQAGAMGFDVQLPKVRAWVQDCRETWERMPTVLTPQAEKLNRILSEWKGQATIDSPGMTAAFFLVREMKPWKSSADAAVAVDLEEGFAQVKAADYAKALEFVAARMQTTYGKVEVPWGEIHGIARNGKWIPLGGGTDYLPAVFQAHGGEYGTVDVLNGDGRIRCTEGSAHLAFTWLGRTQIKRFTISPGGQHNPKLHPKSPHCYDQADLYAQGKYKPFWLREDEVKANLTPYEGQEGYEWKREKVLEFEPEG